eukprot:Pgem_evm1s18957
MFKIIIILVISLLTTKTLARDLNIDDNILQRLERRDLPEEISPENCECPDGYRYNSEQGLCLITQRCSGRCLDGHCQCEFSCMSHLRNGQCVGSFSNVCSRNQYGIIQRNLPVCNGASTTVKATRCTCSDSRYRLVSKTGNGDGQVCRVLRCPGGQRCEISSGRCQCPFECQTAHRGGCIGAGLNGCSLDPSGRYTGAQCSV